MPTITILNHGTMNSSEDKLVITKLKDLMVGPRGGGAANSTPNATWMLNTGVGSFAQAMDRNYVPGWNSLAGTLWAKGLNKNVEESVAFVTQRCTAYGAGNLTVNMAGHSRGSMTALKIANELQQNNATRGCSVNLFLIDPVPGNLGWVNSGMYKNIAINGNVKNAFMFLAESERRNCFRPYVDKCFLYDMPTHRMDTIPGNHGGINEVEVKHNESALVVMNHAVRFLREHGSDLNILADAWKLSKVQLLEKYALIMLKFQKYKHQGAARRNIPFLAMGNTSQGDRTVQVHNSNKQVGLMNVPNLDKNKYDGKGMKTLQRQVTSLEGLSKESRFFANQDHKRVFRTKFMATARYIELLETGFRQKTYNDMTNDVAVRNDIQGMGLMVEAHFQSWQRQILGEAEF